MSMMTAATNRTSDLGFASWLCSQGWVVTAIEATGRHREFVFDREIPRDLFLTFHTSDAKRLLDAHRNLKVLMMQHAG